MSPLLKIMLFLCCITNVIYAQNLIPNGDFESIYKPPRTLSRSGEQFTKSVKKWFAPNDASTDLISPLFEAPIISKIDAKSGKNMVGILANGVHWTEYIGIELTKPLEAGQSYYFECWMAIPNGYKEIPKNESIALNDHFGLYAGDNIYVEQTTSLNYVPNLPANSTFVLEPEKWQKFKGVFKVKKEAAFIYFGQFHDPSKQTPYSKGYFFADNFWLEPLEDLPGTFEPKKVVEQGLNNIYFETDRYEILAPTMVVLDEVRSFLTKNPDLNIEIVGHTDDRGEYYHNLELSDNRAKAVKQYLIEKGIEPERLKTTGKGDLTPIAGNSTPIGRQQNRRVEFLVANKRSKTKAKSITTVEQTYVERLYKNKTFKPSELDVFSIENRFDKNWILANQFKFKSQEPDKLLSNKGTFLLTYPAEQSSIYPLLIELIQNIEPDQLVIHGEFPFSVENYNKSKTIGGNINQTAMSPETVILLNWLKSKGVTLVDTRVEDWKVSKLSRIYTKMDKWKKSVPNPSGPALFAKGIQQKELLEGQSKTVWILNPVSDIESGLDVSKMYKTLDVDMTQVWIHKPTKLVKKATLGIVSPPNSHFKLKSTDSESLLPAVLLQVPTAHRSTASLSGQKNSTFYKRIINLDKMQLPTGELYIFLQNADVEVDFPIYYRSLQKENSEFEAILPKGKLKMLISNTTSRFQQNLE